MNLINNIFINNKKIINFEGKAHTFFAILEDNTKVHTNELKNVEIECSECKKRFFCKIFRRGKNGFLKKIYICKICSCTGEKNPFFGKKHPIEFKEKLSKERKGTWYIGKENSMFGKTTEDIWLEKYGEEKTKELHEIKCKKLSEATTGEKNGFFGKHHTKENCDHLSIKSKNFYESLSEEDKKITNERLINGLKNLQINNPEQYKINKQKANYLSHIAQFNNWKMNKLEEKVFNFLNEKYPDYFKFSIILGKYQFDFGCKEYKILIEVNGDYWHCNPNIYFIPKNQVQKNAIEKDLMKKEFANSHNFKLIVIWEDDIKKNNFTEFEKNINDIIKNEKI